MVLFLLLKMAGHGTVLAAKKYTGGYGAAAAAEDDWQRRKKHFCCLRGCCCSYQRWLAVALLQLLKMVLLLLPKMAGKGFIAAAEGIATAKDGAAAAAVKDGWQCHCCSC